MSKDYNFHGFTLIEVIITILIAGILISVAFRSAVTISDTAKVEETKQELEQLAFSIVGNPELENNGVRTDFGYVGDVGSLPPNLDALISNPGGYSTWNGPYIKKRFSQITNDHKQDAWGVNYTYTGGVNITSTGSGSNIVRKLANVSSDLLINKVKGTVLDLDGTPPGDTYKDSVILRLTIPNGSGSMLTKTFNPDAGGYFFFDSIPIGNHDFEIIYEPNNDTLKRFVSVIPNSSLYYEYYLGLNVWFDTTIGGLVLVPGSQKVTGGDCDKIEFDITNTLGSSVSISSLQLTWSSPTAFYEKVKLNGTVFDNNNPRQASGDITNFSSTRIISAGATETVKIEKFRDTQTGGGNKIDMSNTIFTITFSDGSTFDINMGACQ